MSRTAAKFERLPHLGPICKGCGQPFYYDFIPERHDYSGYCWICFEDQAGTPALPRIEEARR